MVPKSFKTTKEIKVKPKIIDQVIGQDDAVKIMKKAAEQRRHVLLIGEPGTGKCVGKDTFILTDKGPFKAKELFDKLYEKKAFFSVYSLNKNGKIVKKRIVRAYKGEGKQCLRLKTSSGSKLVLSGEHPLLTTENGDLFFKQASDLKIGCWVGKAKRIPEEIREIESPFEKGYVQYCGKNNVKSLKLRVPKVISEKLAYFLGMYVAEGYYDGTIKIYNSNTKVKEFIKRAVIESFDYPENEFKEFKTGIRIKKSRTLAMILEKLFDVSLIRKKQDSKKTVPRVLFNCNKFVIGAFLSGYIDGDGYIGKSGLQLVSSSEELIKSLQLLLLKLGVLSRTRTLFKKATNSAMPKKPYHQLSIFDSENLRKLSLFLNLKLDYKTKRLQKLIKLKSNTNVDVIPNLNEILVKPKELLGLSYDSTGIFSATFSKLRLKQRNPSRDFVKELITLYDQSLVRELEVNQGHLTTVYNLKELEKILIKLDFIASADLFWDRVTGIKCVVDEVYDFEVEDTHNFLIDNGFVVHNSMLGLALAELLPKERLVDILSFPNANDKNQPLIKTVPAGKGREIVAKSKLESRGVFNLQNMFIFMVIILANFIPYWMWRTKQISDIIYAASMVTGMVFVVGFLFYINMAKRTQISVEVPKLIVDNFKKKHAPFFDATGAHAGALLGDVLHDPFQSGGLGTPPHERVIAGMIHKANNGVLFIDEIATLKPATQQELLTSLQERRYAITGQSERSAGAMVRTEMVPCNFILVAAGNVATIKNMHPALRSRIRGYGYEVYMNNTIPDTPENRWKLAVFVAQEIAKDKKIPHFTKQAVDEIVVEAMRMANRKGHLTLRLRELGGLVRAAGDLAKERKSKFVQRKHVIEAKKIARTLEQQIADKYIEQKKEYEVIITSGKKIGRVNGLAVIGSGSAYSGIILPIEAEVTPGGEEKEIIATGKLGEIAKEAVKNVSAIIKKYFGEDIKKTYDIYVQFLQTYEGVEGDSASIAVATAIISALKKIPVKQNYALTGSLSVRGGVLPVGGVSSKVEASIDAGIKNIIVPKSNVKDIVVSKDKLKKIRIIPVDNISQVLKESLDWKGKKATLRKILKG